MRRLRPLSIAANLSPAILAVVAYFRGWLEIMLVCCLLMVVFAIRTRRELDARPRSLETDS